MLDLYLGIIAVAAFAIIAEKDKWLNNQVIQALLLYLLYHLLIVVIDWSVGGLLKLLVLTDSFNAAAVLRDIIGVIKDVAFVAYLVFTIIALLRCITGKNGVSFLSKTSNKLTGLTENQKENNKKGTSQKEITQNESDNNNE